MGNRTFIGQFKDVGKASNDLKTSPKPPNSRVKNHVESLRKALTRIESERNLSKLLSFVYEQQSRKQIMLQPIYFNLIKLRKKKCRRNSKYGRKIANSH